MTKHYFIADTHFGHSNIHMKFRKEFSSQEEHNETIHENIMTCGNKQDYIWLLGDIIFKESEFWRISAYAKKFQQVYLILGNHDAKSLPRYALQHKNVCVMGVEQRWGLWLTHVPVPDYELYRGNCIHGHLHSKVVQDLSVLDHYDVATDEELTDQRYFCVSCEQVNYKPTSLNDIKDIRGWK
jgi:calcineurin-like phosphoesterase family protein